MGFFKRHRAGLTGILFAICFTAMIVFIVYHFSELKKAQIKEHLDCDGFADFESQYGCCKDCKSLGMDYLKYQESGGWSKAEDCFCRKEGGVEQIW